MALVKVTLFSELLGTFVSHSPDPMKPGKDIAKAFANYLKMGMMTDLLILQNQWSSDQWCIFFRNLF